LTVEQEKVMGPIPDYDIAALTDPGRKRHDEPNQDQAYFVPADPQRDLPPLLVVADGMGGHVGGAVASQKVVDAIVQQYKQAVPCEDYPSLLKECLQAAYQALYNYAQSDSSFMSMGSTAVLAVPENNRVHVANVGDSRAYLLHGQEMTQLSYDHSVVADLVRAGQITPMQARSHPKRNRLTQSLSPKRKEYKSNITVSPFGEDDTLLLCTDGLWGVIPESIIQAVTLELSPQEAAVKLIGLAKNSGGPDNISVIIARRKGAKLIMLDIGEEKSE
jgi:PPM family protein phosphatase